MPVSIMNVSEVAIIVLLATTVIGIDSEHHERRSEGNYKFITFNNDESNIRLEMVFAIPFLHIPIGGGHSSGTSLRPTVDVNLKSLVVAGAVFCLLFFIVPGLIRVTIPNSPITRGWQKSDAGLILEGVETSLKRYGIDANACFNDGICYMLNKAKENVKEGQASSWDKIIDGIASDRWLNPMLQYNLIPTDCSPHFICPIMKYNFTNLLHKLRQNVKNISFHVQNLTNVYTGR